MIVFQILSGGRAKEIVQSDAPIILIGREPSCDLQLDPYQDLTVHGQHARVYFSDNSYFVEDLNTKNGTYVDGKPLKTPLKIEVGTIFCLGEDGPEIIVEKWDNQLSSPKKQRPFKLIRQGSLQTFKFNQLSIQIGRQPDCDLSLDPIQEREVSGYHAAIRYDSDGYYLEDLNSANGTFLNGVICTRNKLAHGATFQLGKAGPEFQFLEDIPETIQIEETQEKAIDFKKLKEAREPAEKKKPSRRRKAKKDGNGKFAPHWEKLQKHLSELNIAPRTLYTILGVVVVVFFIWIFATSSSSRSIDPLTFEKDYQDSVAVVYCRYLIYVNDQIYRGEHYGCGILNKEKKEVTFLTTNQNIYPWINEIPANSQLELITHIVAVWPNNNEVFENGESSHKNFNFFASFNNDNARLGGKGMLIIPQPIPENVRDVCKIKLENVENWAKQNVVSWYPTQITQNKFYYMVYNTPSMQADQKLKLALLEKTAGNFIASPDQYLYGGPVMTPTGQLLGLSFEQNNQEIDYIQIKSLR